MTTTLNVHNIKCGGCAASIIDKLSKIGVSNINVDPNEGTVSFESQSENDLEKIKATLSQMGYPEEDPNMMQTAKSFVSCMVGRIKK